MNSLPALSRSRRRLWWTGVTYLACMAGLVAGLFELRRRTLTAHGTAAGQAAWEQWQAAERQNREDPQASVQRKVPKSTEPPALVIMRDHFAAVVGISLATSTVMFGMVALALVNSAPGRQRTTPATKTT